MANGSRCCDTLSCTHNPTLTSPATGAMHAQVMYPGELAMSSGFVCTVEGLTACSALLRQVSYYTTHRHDLVTVFVSRGVMICSAFR